MFMKAFEFIVLAGLAAAGILGVLFGRRVLSLLSLRGEVEAVKVRTELDGLKHNRVVQQHQQHLQVKALTSGSSEEPVEKSVFAQEPKPEVVDVSKKDVASPSGFVSDREERDHLFQKMGAEEAEYKDLPTTA